MAVGAMKKIRFSILSFSIVFSIVSCAKKGSDDWDFAISPGSYLLTGPVCLSTNASPRYKKINQRINLFDFDAVQLHSLKIDGPTSFRTISDGACTVKINQPINLNKNGSFSNQLTRQISFEPEGCAFSVSIGSETFAVSSQSTEGLQDRNSTDMDLPFIVSTTDSGFDMVSGDVADLNNLWGDYGCNTPDRIKWSGQPE